MGNVRWSKTLLALSVVGLLGAGSACGDDEGASSSPPPAAKKKVVAKSAPAAAKGGGQAGYPKVDEELRHQLTETDFRPDASGETNRDPFRSWVLLPAAEASGDEENKKKVDVCTQDKVRWGAPNYSVRDLVLIGIVKRGRSFAQFTDRSEGESWIVRTGDCLGQEKAIINEVGVGFVDLSITAPASPNAPAPPTQKQIISLHPDEIEIGDSILSGDGEEDVE